MASSPSMPRYKPTVGQPCPCQGCGVEFPSKNAVFRHLSDTLGACLPESERRDFLQYVHHQRKREKVVLLYGYWIPPSSSSAGDNDDTPRLKNGEDAARVLMEVVESLVPAPPNKTPSANAANEQEDSTATNNKEESSNQESAQNNNNSRINRSYGHSSRGTHAVLAQEDGTSAITELVTTKLPKLPAHAVSAWIDTVNAAVEERFNSSKTKTNSKDHDGAFSHTKPCIRVFGRQSMPLTKFNAEMDVTHRKVEYLLPADFLVTEQHDTAFFESLPGFGGSLAAQQQSFAATDDAVDGVNTNGSGSNNNHNPRAGRSVDAYLDYMTNLKRIMKNLSTHIEVLDTNDAAAVLEKEFHKQKRQRNRDFHQNKTKTGDNDKSEDDETNNQFVKAQDDAINNEQRNQNNSESEGDEETETKEATIAVEKPKGDDERTKHAAGNNKKKKTKQQRNSKRDRQREHKLKKKRTLAKNPDKKEGVLRRKRYHNFTPTLMAHEFLAYRRLDRFFHRATLRLDDGHRRPFLALCLSGDMFLHGQACRLVGLLIALARGVVEADFCECVLDEQYPHLVPTPPAPGHALYAGEVSYIATEGKIKAILTPRVTDRYDKGWNDADTVQRVNEWHTTLRENVARVWLEKGVDGEGRLIAEKEWTESVLEPWGIKARKQLEHYRRWKEERSAVSCSGPSDKKRQGENAPTAVCSVPPLMDVDPEVPQEYRKVLHLLREADASGLWPSTNAKRQLVMVSNIAEAEDCTVDSNGISLPSSLSMARLIAKANKNEASTASAYSFVEGFGGASGSFSVGAMPGDGCDQPKGNTLFPELMKAAFELEMTLYPEREPSSTIAVNRNSQFRPHTDSGAGAGQSTSLIVAMGTFSGGELVVEGEQRDIRYKPVEFNGWRQRHWTMPFLGERYSLVWFTPKGCEGVRGIDLCE